MHLLRLIVLLLLPLLALNAAAQTLTAPVADELRSRLAALAERKLPEADQRAAQQALEQALASLATAADLRAQREALQASVAAAPQGHPRRTRTARHSAGADRRGAGDRPRHRRRGARTPPRGEQRRPHRLAPPLDEANTLLVNARTGPERAQSEISASQARMATIEIALGSGREPGRDGRALSAERRDALAAEWHALDAQMALRRADNWLPTACCSTSGQSRQEVLPPWREAFVL